MHNNRHQHFPTDSFETSAEHAATRVVLGLAKWRLQESRMMLLDFIQPTMDPYEALEALRQAEGRIDEWLKAHG